MNILVALKAVPLVGDERLDDAWRTQRGQLEANGADEYLLERAIQLTEDGDGEVSVLTVGPAGAAEAVRKALAMGAARAYHVSDDAAAGSDIRATVDLIVAAAGKIEFDLLFMGADSSDGQGGVVGAAVAARLRLPYLSNAADVSAGETDGWVRVTRLSPSGHDVSAASMPAVVMGTQVLGEPRYPSLRGIMAARQKETITWSLADIGIDAAGVGEGAATTAVTAAEPPPERAGARVVEGTPDEAATELIAFLVERRVI